MVLLREKRGKEWGKGRKRTKILKYMMNDREVKKKKLRAKEKEGRNERRGEKKSRN